MKKCAGNGEEGMAAGGWRAAAAVGAGDLSARLLTPDKRPPAFLLGRAGARCLLVTALAKPVDSHLNWGTT